MPVQPNDPAAMEPQQGEGQGEMQDAKGFQKLVVGVHTGLLTIVDVLQRAGAPEEAVAQIKGAQEQFAGALQALSSGQSNEGAEEQPAPEQAPPQRGPVPQEAGVKGVPRL